MAIHNKIEDLILDCYASLADDCAQNTVACGLVPSRDQAARVAGGENRFFAANHILMRSSAATIAAYMSGSGGQDFTTMMKCTAAAIAAI